MKALSGRIKNLGLTVYEVEEVSRKRARLAGNTNLLKLREITPTTILCYALDQVRAETPVLTSY